MAVAAETPKHERIMELVVRLTDGEILKKSELVEEFGVNARSIQRDLDDLKAFFANRRVEDGGRYELNYDYGVKGYRLRLQNSNSLTDGETLTICKILLESRSLRKDEMFPILEKLIHGCVPVQSRKQAEKLIANEKHLYIEPHHGKSLVELLWEIGQAVREQRYLQIEYTKLKNKETVVRRVKPVGIMFSEFYFYLTAYIDHPETEDTWKTPSPAIYRVDRLQSCKMQEERFHIPYKDRFQEGEFRKRVQFMFGGELKTVRFQYRGLSIEAVLDRLPTAKVLEEKDGVYTVEAEVFGDGIEMWLRSQAPWITRI